MFFKLFKFEFKRYFTDAALLIIVCIVPIILVLTILGSLLPILFRGAELNEINIALFNEDSTYETNMIIRHLTESDSVEAFVDVVEVDSLAEGEAMMAEGEASALIHIPLNLQENLYQGNSETLYFYAGEEDTQIVRLLYDMLSGGLDNINKAQKSVDIVYYAMRDMGYERQDASAEYSSMARALFTDIISRSQIYKGYNEVSATGDYLNIEYYMISTLLLCLFFLSLPICAKMNHDISSGVLDRDGFYLNSFGYTSAKLLSGSLFLLIPSTITVVFILLITGSFGLFSGSIPLMIITAVAAAIYFAVIMICIGTHTKTTTAALWIGFSAALIISAVSGIFIPRNLMPRWIVNIAEFTGLPAVIRLYGASLFGVKSSDVLIDLIKISAVNVVVFALSYLKTRKRLIKQ